ncbi:His-Xaa-Ser system radical SAM maturase HxsC [Azospira oryzae]
MGESMLTLSGKVIQLQTTMPSGRHLWVLSTNPDLPRPLRCSRAFLINSAVIPSGFSHYLAFGSVPVSLPERATCTVLGNEFSYLGENDVISLTSDGRIRSMFRANSPHNSIMLTEQCNNYCLMCSQPPKNVDDRWLLDEAMELVRLIPRHAAKVMCISGGEPTLLGDGFIDLLHLLKSRLPDAALHVLSNGRRFSNVAFSKKYAAVQHPDLMVGIPVYSADPAKHDYVVQAKGAFDETIRGILNLKRLNQRVEIRVVVHKQTCDGLPALAEYIARNLLFVDQVALMGLEMTGFTRANLESLWIDPVEYKDKLSQAVKILQNYGIKVSVYNQPLCLVSPDIEQAYVKSISDWKNEYAQECGPCTRKSECGGFFSSAIQYGYSGSISPFQ